VNGLLHEEITGLVLKAFYSVYNSLGYGFLERVYENALAISLRKLGLSVRQQCPIRVQFEGVKVGEYTADLVVNQKVLVELKAARTLTNEHEAQLLNYLTATPYEVGLLLNFGPEPQYRRRIFHNHLKKSVKISVP
jgi:GxxExxY protein